MLSSRYSNTVADQLTKNLIGASREFKTAPEEIKTIVKHHERLHALRQFALASRDPLPQKLTPDGKIVSDEPTPNFLYDRGEAIAGKLNELKDHIEKEQKLNKRSKDA